MQTIALLPWKYILSCYYSFNYKVIKTHTPYRYICLYIVKSHTLLVIHIFIFLISMLDYSTTLVISISSAINISPFLVPFKATVSLIFISSFVQSFLSIISPFALPIFKVNFASLLNSTFIRLACLSLPNTETELPSSNSWTVIKFITIPLLFILQYLHVFLFSHYFQLLQLSLM